MNTFLDGGEGGSEGRVGVRERRKTKESRSDESSRRLRGLREARSRRVSGATRLSGSEALVFWPPLNREREAPILLKQRGSGSLFTALLWNVVQTVD